MSECLFAAVFSINKIICNISKLMLSRRFSRACIKISECSRLFPTVDLRDVFTCLKAEKMPSPLAFVAYQSKSNLTIFSTSLIKKHLFHGGFLKTTDDLPIDQPTKCTDHRLTYHQPVRNFRTRKNLNSYLT